MLFKRIEPFISTVIVFFCAVTTAIHLVSYAIAVAQMINICFLFEWPIDVRLRIEKNTKDGAKLWCVCKQKILTTTITGPGKRGKKKAKSERNEDAYRVPLNVGNVFDLQ